MDDGARQEPVAPPPWLRAAPVDIAGFDVDRVIAGSTSADAFALSTLFQTASSAARAEAGGSDCPASRVADLLASVLSMHFKPETPNEPFGPMFVSADGRRTAVPEDFRGHVDVLATLAGTTAHPVLRARLSDLAWLLDRKRASLGVVALNAYVESVRRIESGALTFGGGEDDWPFHPDTRDTLIRALGLARLLGWSKPEADAAREQLLAIRRRAVMARATTAVHWYCELDLQHRVSDPLGVAHEIEAVIADLPTDRDFNVAVDLWKLASRAYQAAKREDDVHRCRIAAAETLASAAEGISSAMLASHLLASAISELHGIASARPRRTALKHKLVDLQAGIGEEMSTFSQDIDLTAIVQAVQDRFGSLSLNESLFAFAALGESPDPDALRASALEQLREHPLSALFPAAHLDEEGKVVHRTAGGVDPSEHSTLMAQIAMTEGMRRHVEASGKIEPARRLIVSNHYLADDVLLAFTRHSPFVPEELARTFARGFARFFQGDFISGLYILTPLLENSLRYVLKSHGHDVTTFDNAAQTQEDRTITSLFDAMRPELDAVFTRAITDDIHRVFLGRPGPAIRHAVAHGLLHDGSPESPDALYACWLIFRLCVLPLFPHREQLGLT